MTDSCLFYAKIINELKEEENRRIVKEKRDKEVKEEARKAVFDDEKYKFSLSIVAQLLQYTYVST